MSIGSVFLFVLALAHRALAALVPRVVAPSAEFDMALSNVSAALHTKFRDFSRSHPFISFLVNPIATVLSNILCEFYISPLAEFVPLVSEDQL